MDAAIHGAIVAVRIEDDAAVQRWFEAVCAACVDQTDWSQFCSRLTEGAASAGVDSHIVEQFVEHMNAHDPAPMETLGRMAELGTELPGLYRQLAAEAQAQAQGQGDAGGGHDEQAWQGFLQEHGVRWDGQEGSWEQFKAWFVYEGEQRGLGEPVSGFMAYVEGQHDKVGAFAQYGLTIAGAAQEQQHAQHGQQQAQNGEQAQQGEQQAQQDVSNYPEVKQGDTGEWVDYLDAMLTRHGF